LRDGGDREVVVQARFLDEDSQAMEVFVHSTDRSGLFAAIAITLDRMGLATLQARALDGPGGTIFDSFQVIPGDTRHPPDTDAIARDLAAALADALDEIRPARRTLPSHLRHFRIVPNIAFSDSADGRATIVSLVCTDRPGLLADVAHTLRQQGLRVYDARIATFGERAEDGFRVGDAGGSPLAEEGRERLREALLARIDGEANA
jgi:[protein-PII] uridylyltransferase